MSLRLIIISLLLVMGAFGVAAHDKDAPFAEWFMSLKQPDSPSVSCCGPSDQYYVDEYYMTDDRGFMAKVKGIWIKVPPYKVDWKDVNPTGQGVIFLSGSTESWAYKDAQPVYCFIPGVGT